MFDVEVITDRDAAVAALDPLRSKILGLLVEPGSATTLAATLGMPRQQINYHLRMLEANGLVHLVEERPRRGLTERVMTANQALAGLNLPLLTPEQGQIWLEDSRQGFDDRVRDPWE